MQLSRSNPLRISQARTLTFTVLAAAWIAAAAAGSEALAQDRKVEEPPPKFEPPAKPREAAPPTPPRVEPPAKPRDVAPPTPSSPRVAPPAKPRDVAPPTPPSPKAEPPARRVPPSRPPVLDDDARIPKGVPPARDGGGRVTPSKDDRTNGKDRDTRPAPGRGTLTPTTPTTTTPTTPTTPTRPTSRDRDGKGSPAIVEPRVDKPAGDARRGGPLGVDRVDAVAPSPRADKTRVVDSIARRQDRFVSPSVGGVPISLAEPLRAPSSPSAALTEPVTATYTAYVTGISHANGWHPSSRWSSCGPAHVWQPYVCRRGLSISVGFGSGFSFGFFYGTSCAPLVSSWCNPWWDGYASYWTCAPRHCAWGDVWWRNWCRPSWSAWHCWSPHRPWWWSSYAFGPCPWPAWTPSYAYAPIVCATVIPSYTVTTVVTPVSVPVVQPVAPPNPQALWSALAAGYDDNAEDGFAALAAADPRERVWFVGQGFARAFRGETAWAAVIIEQALATDPSSIERVSSDPLLVARLEALERSLAPLTSSGAPSLDAMLVTAASQAARGDLDAAYFTATSAQAEGDRRAGTAALADWLRGEIRRRGMR